MNNTHIPDLYYGFGKPELPEWGGRLPVALVFPGPEKLALSTLGWQVVYRMLGDDPAFAVERFYIDPKGSGRPRSADSDRPLNEFPVIAVSLNFEEEFLAFAKMLMDANIPLRAHEREDEYPLVVVGGPITFLNPAPVAPAVDLFWIGEAEAGFDGLLRRAAAHYMEGGRKGAFVEAVKNDPGVYAPGRSATPVARVMPESGDRELATPAYSCFISSYAEFSDMLLLEVNRGCPYSCRFCAAGYIYRPPRHADVDRLKAIVEETNPPKVGLVGTALTDWPDLFPFLKWLKERGTKFSLSSVRADGLTEEFLEFLRRTGARTITLALEAPSRRLRDAANKNLEEEDFLRAVRLISKFRFNHLKIYCIIGWPGETDEDYDELEAFLGEIQKARLEGQGRKGAGLELVTFSVSPLVPKPWTPFQWAPTADEKHIKKIIERVRKMAKPYRGFRAEGGTAFSARLQALLSRGGEEVFGLIEKAAETGNWRKALKEWGGDVASIIDREREEDETFPWEVIDNGISREHLYRQWQMYRQARPWRPCPPEGCDVCRACGIEKRFARSGDE